MPAAGLPTPQLARCRDPDSGPVLLTRVRHFMNNFDKVVVTEAIKKDMIYAGRNRINSIAPHLMGTIRCSHPVISENMRSCQITTKR